LEARARVAPHPLRTKKIGSKGCRTVDFASGFVKIFESTNLKPRSVKSTNLDAKSTVLKPSKPIFWFEGARSYHDPWKHTLVFMLLCVVISDVIMMMTSVTFSKIKINKQFR
jgi:hypothetical protein